MSMHRVTISATLDGQICQNVMHFNNPDGTKTASQIADSIETVWLANWKQFSHSGLVWFDIAVRELGSLLAVFHKTIVVAGTGGGETEPDCPVIARVIKLQTAVAGKHGRGRLFIPGMSKDAWVRGLVKPASITAGLPLMAALKSAYITAGGSESLRLYVMPRNGTVTADGYQVEELVQRTTLGYQRRRSIGIGM